MRARRIAVVGGGPGGLFLATLLRHSDPSLEVTVYERNRPDDTFGFGVVFSDRTLAAIDDADPVLRHALDAHGRHWEQIEIRAKDQRIRCAGNGMSAISRRRLLGLLQERAQSAGAELRFGTEVRIADLQGADLIVGADGTNSRIRDSLAGLLKPTVDVAAAKFIWFGTDYLFDGLTFVHERSPHGVFAVHGYPISHEVSTFIVETDEAAWRSAGLDDLDDLAPAGTSDLRTKGYLEKLFAEQIDGHSLLVNNSRWGNFRTRSTLRWHTRSVYGPVVLLGDAAHTAHFSVGSGTKMAMEDAVALAGALVHHPDDLTVALDEYEASARPSVDAIQAAARPSLSWWEHFGRYHDALPPWQFAYHFLSRSIGDARLARRDPCFVAATHDHWCREKGRPPLDTPLALRGGEVIVPRRAVRVLEAGSSRGALDVPGRSPVPLLESPPTRTDAGGPWGAWIGAPDDETGLAAARRHLRVLVDAGAAVAAVHGGTELTRRLVSEEARFVHGCPSVIVDPCLDRDGAVTAVLSGRADAVGAHPVAVDAWVGGP